MPFSLHSRRRRIIGATCGVEKSIDEVGTPVETEINKKNMIRELVMS
jgi:hypothetical protein